jgi:hypothetical protein
MAKQRSLAVVLATSVVFSTSGWTGWAGVAAAAGPHSISPAAAMLAPSTGSKLAILPLTVEGPISESDQAELTKALTAGLERGSFSIVGPEGVLAADPKAGACNNAVCYQNIATRTGAAYVVRAVVSVKDRDYTVKVELVGADGKRLAATQDGCEICGVVDASGLIDSAAATLRLKLDALSKGPASLKLTSNPEGSIVAIDGEIVGETPLERPIVPGKHLIRVSEEGYISIEREVTFVEGVNEDLNFSLEKLPSRLPGRRFGYVSLGFGLAALGGAIGFAILDDEQYRLGGKCDDNYQDGDGMGDFNSIPGEQSITSRDECAKLWQTEGISIPMAIAGGALLTLGIAILVNSRQKTKQEKTRATARRQLPRFGVGPGSVSISGRF